MKNPLTGLKSPLGFRRTNPKEIIAIKIIFFSLERNLLSDIIKYQLSV